MKARKVSRYANASKPFPITCGHQCAFPLPVPFNDIFKPVCFTKSRFADLPVSRSPQTSAYVIAERWFSVSSSLSFLPSGKPDDDTLQSIIGCECFLDRTMASSAGDASRIQNRRSTAMARASTAR